MKKLLSMIAVLGLMSAFAIANDEPPTKDESAEGHKKEATHGHAKKKAHGKKAKKGEHSEEHGEQHQEEAHH